MAITKHKTLVVTSSFQNIRIWDLPTQKLIRTIPITDEEYSVHSLVLTPDSQFIVAGLQGPLQEGGRLSIWRIADGEMVHSQPFHQHFQGYCQELNTLTTSKVGLFIVGTARDLMVKVWMNFLSYMELEEGFMRIKRNPE
ncbi:MAG: WD40 repeat domain-containing protein [Promethearchaeota archaeon]